MSVYRMLDSQSAYRIPVRESRLVGRMIPRPHLDATIRVKRAVAALEAGQIVLHPTDTVPGLTCHPGHNKSITSLSFVKGRPIDKALLSLVHCPEKALKYMASLPPGWRRALDLLWPGPLSVIWQASELAPRSLVASDGTIGLRVPHLTATSEWYRAVLREVNLPLPTTSVNRSASPPAKTWRQAQDFCRRSAGYIFDPTDIDADEMIGEAGRTEHARSLRSEGLPVNRSPRGSATSSSNPIPSTVVALAPDGRFDILRAGVVSQRTIEDALQRPGRDI